MAVSDEKHYTPDPAAVNATGEEVGLVAHNKKRADSRQRSGVRGSSEVVILAVQTVVSAAAQVDLRGRNLMMCPATDMVPRGRCGPRAVFGC